MIIYLLNLFRSFQINSLFLVPGLIGFGAIGKKKQTKFNQYSNTCLVSHTYLEFLKVLEAKYLINFRNFNYPHHKYDTKHNDYCMFRSVCNYVVSPVSIKWHMLWILCQFFFSTLFSHLGLTDRFLTRNKKLIWNSLIELHAAKMYLIWSFSLVGGFFTLTG